MNSIKSTQNKNFKTYSFNGKTFYPSFYFNHSNNYSFNKDSKIVINGQNYFTK